ncbi:putative iron-regulated membrane protein [Azospirillum lipoferum]|uniref:PepSY domain-containing protein n=1 Tax=Azospirillum lipoferum TaxID=193 RepID=A0A5A9GQ85_AZOLI|nr:MULTISPECIES: PepSY-associated TM helix domain-containing protein [Azospirillum]KAA0596533.1 PepSY domain-containing protein [Azospirillum lipoferum]MCP1610534.1 putative iron-regulated membrane protein [Azospirillum lipoferum]MDW5538023.1 PepSY-associated TM helix domain-containing protein [Azospirillum sp. NL1]
MATASKPRSQHPWYRTLQTIHLWVGLILCLPLVVLGITGSILVVDEELRGLIGDAPAKALADGPMQPVSAILAAARAAAPAGTQPGFLVLPEEPGRPATVRLVAARERGGERPQGPQQGPQPGLVGMLTIDPVSLVLVGGADPAQASGGFLRTVHLLHGNLLIRDRSGREVVGWLGVAMLVLGVSGLVLWWPRPGRWKAAFTVKAGARGIRLHRELHGAVGIWSLLVFLIVSFSGVYLAFPQTLGAGVSSILPARDLRAAVTVQPVKGAVPIDVDRSVGLARAAMPEAALRSVSLPARPDQAYRIGLVPAGQAHGAPGATVFVDPWTAQVAEVRDPAGYSAGETVIAWQRPLHAGEGLGPVWKWAVFLSGILPPLFAVTGTLMWWLKRKARRAKDAERAAALAAAE